MDPNPESYVDTSALIGFWDRGARHHATYLRLFAEPPPVVTSALVIAEGDGWFLRRVHPRRATEFLSFVRAMKALSVVPFGQDETGAIRPLLAKFEDQGLTLADAHGLLIMRARGI